MHVLATAGGSANGPGVWACLAILAATAAGYLGIPFIGSAAISAAAVFASRGKLNIAAVLIVTVIGNEVDGLLGYKIGDRWGGRSSGTPGPALEPEEPTSLQIARDLGGSWTASHRWW
jgi:membrane protein DedA with SNARE-associated domain